MLRVDSNEKTSLALAFGRAFPGCPVGFDRLCALFGGVESIRDFIAFPKNNSGRDVMIDAPSTIDQKQLDELSIALNIKS